MICIPLLGCSAGPKGAELAANALLSVAGLKLTEKNTVPVTRQVSLRFEASHDLNAAATGQGVATVVRVYKLRNQDAFLSASYRMFGDTDKEKTVLGNDVSEVREFILMPGQTIRINEKLTADAAYLGVATLFRKASPQRWRMAFNAVDVEQAGLVLGVHACAMTSSGAIPVGIRRDDALLLSTAPCSE
ncbi:type VI secretion system lipoprotein TssJ [Herbaspirillum sp. GCM10030257]|uniref:type VI secretion system lipoprotein TssJ n=1 Tax=Herbaspirillum sp. GCM10030257 TaxID=3273393 RepID=UPI00361D9D23